MKRSSPALSKKSAFFWGESDFWRKWCIVFFLCWLVFRHHLRMMYEYALHSVLFSYLLLLWPTVKILVVVQWHL
jgi:hypothetical protein